MFENYEDDQDNTPLVKQLRAAVEKANSALKAKDEELNKLSSQVKTQSVREILRDLKVNPKVANLIPSDLEPTADAVGKWVKEYEDVFGAALHVEANPESGDDKGNEAAPEAQARPDVDDATANALNRLQSAEASAGVIPPDREQAQIAALAAIGNNSKSAQDVLDFLSGKSSLPS
jgi:hypothetical protein